MKSLLVKKRLLLPRINDILTGQSPPPISYEDSDQSPLKGNEARDRKERGPFQANRAKRKERSKKWSKFRLLEHRGSHQIEAQSRA